ncbi:hypothetical protein Bca4012_078494 [Brassica carinata]
MRLETDSGLTRAVFVRDSGEMKGEIQERDSGKMSDEITTCVAVERELEDGEFDLGNESRVSPKPTSPLHLHSTGGKEGRHKIDLS